VPKPSIITLFHNRRDLVRAYLEQWRRGQNRDSVELILGDSGSTDGVAALVTSAADLADVAIFPSNLGFARGNNELARRARGDVLVFLNYDVQLIDGWLEPILAAFSGWPALGIVGNVQLSVRARETDHAGMFFDDEGRPFHFHPPLVALENLPLLPVPAVTGACLAIRRSLFESLGGFDERYQNGYEDVDLCLRARATGAEIAVATSSVIWHYGCASPGRHAMEEANARLFESRWHDLARSLSDFQPPILCIPPSRAKDHRAFATHQTLQVFYPASNGYSEEQSSVHLYPKGRWGRIEIILPRSFTPSETPLRLDPGWEPGTTAIGGLAIRSGPQRKLTWQVHGSRLAELCTPAGTCRKVPGQRGVVLESTGNDAQLLVKLPRAIFEQETPLSLEVWLRGGTDGPTSPALQPTAHDHDHGEGSQLPRERDGAVRVLVDLTRLTPNGEGGGIKPALLGMLRWLGKQDDPPLHFVHVTAPGTLPEVVSIMRPCDRTVSGVTAPPDLAAQESCDVVYCPFGITDFSCPGIPTVTLVVDLLLRDFSSSLTEPDRIYREQCLTRALECTDWFQVISNYTAMRLEQHGGIPASRFVRTYQPVHERLSSLTSKKRDPSPKIPFFFYPANAWAHKNHETLLVAYVLYRQMEGSNAWPLVLTGHDGPAMARVRALSRTLRLDDCVQFREFVSEQRLAELWTSAGALVFPSLHEGFGIPLLEAMAHGVPIVAHNGTAIPEVVGQAALLVDARDPVKLASGMARISHDGPLRNLLVERGRRRVADFSADVEFGKLHRLLAHAGLSQAKWRRTGYCDVDGLTAPVAVFALPVFAGLVDLSVSLRSLPAGRTLQVWCGRDLIGEMKCPAFSPSAERFAFEPKSRALTLRVLDASRLCDTDPRTHGVLLESLTLRTAEGTVHDLLG
jgi:GT2 family glycosyltransferase/glycosyltransferase involved in cell wall biosynthesis